MRNPKRIPEVLHRIEELWTKYPDMRLCQLVYCITNGKDIFNIEDEDFIKMLERTS